MTIRDAGKICGIETDQSGHTFLLFERLKLKLTLSHTTTFYDSLKIRPYLSIEQHVELLTDSIGGCPFATGANLAQ